MLQEDYGVTSATCVDATGQDRLGWSRQSTM